ncbi:hypothetical protein APHAL10511_000656 [Amanita phalloides]|nr:hypothetical protein APHAL10511_000656 [Amanita phalloides]
MAAATTTVLVIRDEEFYFQDIIFQVENRLFKVPRYVFLRESQVFRDLFSLPVPEGSKPDGISDARPLKLDGIKALDFSRLLRLLFPQKPDSETLPLKTLDEWTSVFKLAAQWDMEDVKAKAVQMITPLLENAPAKQVKMALEHGVDEWLVPALNRLVQREEPMDKTDVDLIGLDFALKVMALREDCFYNTNNNNTWSIKRRGKVSMDTSKEIRIRFNIRQ